MFSIPHLNTLRRAEIDRIVAFFEPQARVLEIGAGTGEQALELKRRGFEVTAIEIANSNYALNRQFPIIDYDGQHIPLPDASVDIVFSSNVLEHVPDLSQMHAEIRRSIEAYPAIASMCCPPTAGVFGRRCRHFRKRCCISLLRCRSCFRAHYPGMPNCAASPSRGTKARAT